MARSSAPLCPARLNLEQNDLREAGLLSLVCGLRSSATLRELRLRASAYPEDR